MGASMTKNKWSLYKWQYSKNYPSVYYIWVDEKDTVQFIRSVEPLGFMPSFPPEIQVGNGKAELRKLNPQIKKASHKMNDESLKRGWLIL
jgi:hypothetical protein